MTQHTDPPHRAVWSGLVSSAGAGDADVGVLGLPFDGASSFRLGSAQAPARIRSLTPHVAPFTEEGLSLDGLRVHDLGDVQETADWTTFSAAAGAAAETAFDCPFALFLGGDHAVTIPLFEAAARSLPAPIGVLHFDAHLDLMSSFEGHSWSHACTARRILESPAADPARFAFVGIRSWLGDERVYVDEHPQLAVHTAREVNARGPAEIAKAVCGQLAGCASVYITVDIDVLDPAFAPGTGTPEAGGLPTRDLLEILRTAFHDLPVRALDVVEVSPPLDTSDITSIAAIKLIYEAFGWILARR